jgi:hypothetical protein
MSRFPKSTDESYVYTVETLCYLLLKYSRMRAIPDNTKELAYGNVRATHFIYMYWLQTNIIMVYFIG